ncbi:unnamed protein product [Periconia digitata]|uniref:Uncharacterized protein n=1 Tax=Periconia digitata TaxID=1303443 RepID=A0A9W4UHU7_9PLEO|nr:unnamed protein product [Periconia digitata]
MPLASYHRTFAQSPTPTFCFGFLRSDLTPVNSRFSPYCQWSRCYPQRMRKSTKKNQQVLVP